MGCLLPTHGCFVSALEQGWNALDRRIYTVETRKSFVQASDHHISHQPKRCTSSGQIDAYCGVPKIFTLHFPPVEWEKFALENFESKFEVKILSSEFAHFRSARRNFDAAAQRLDRSTLGSVAAHLPLAVNSILRLMAGLFRKCHSNPSRTSTSSSQLCSWGVMPTCRST